MKWIKENLSILILAGAILIHALAVIQSTQADYNYQRVKIVNQSYEPVKGIE